MILDGDQNERRSEPRTTLVHRPLLIEAENFVGFCMAKNISSSGMMGKFYRQCKVGTRVNVHFNDAHVVVGLIAWSSEVAIGIKFDAPINVEEMLARLSLPMRRGRISRAPRLPINVSAEIVCDGRTVPVDLIDISQRGVKLRSPFLNVGDEVLVMIESLDTRKAIVKWAKGGFAGLNFLRPLDFDRLAEWAVRKQMNQSGITNAPEGRTL